jgi:putative DNA primase/helicase
VFPHAGDDRDTQLEYVRAKLGRVPPAPKSETVYVYRDEHGKPVLEVVRKGDGADKIIYQRPPRVEKDKKYVPYRLPELLEAVANEQTVFIAEGEKAVEALVRLGVVATCSPMGASKWRDEYSQHLKGASVVILPDNDEPGRAHTEQVAKSLTGIAASIKTIALPDLPQAGDAYDWIAKGGISREAVGAC